MRELLPEDYTEPRCLLDMSRNKERATARVPVERILKKLDEYVGKRDNEAAERHLKYWLAEAEADGDDHGRLTLLNEFMGFYRKANMKDDAYKFADIALRTIEDEGRDGSIVSATTYINAATVYKTFDDSERAYPLFCRAREIYEAKLPQNDGRLGGLYNNMALALADLGRYVEAKELYRRAISVTLDGDGDTIDAATSYMNMANAIEADAGLLDGADEIEDCLACAEAVLDAASDRQDTYYAYVCERCAPGLAYYGHFAASREIAERAKRIYEGA